MGLTYHPRNKKVDSFDVNLSGADLLGGAHHALGLPLSNAGKNESPFRVPYSMKAAEARTVAKQIAQKTDDEIRAVIGSERLERCWGGESLDEWVEWIREWGNFLQNCSGYKTD